MDLYYGHIHIYFPEFFQHDFGMGDLREDMLSKVGKSIDEKTTRVYFAYEEIIAEASVWGDRNLFKNATKTEVIEPPPLFTNLERDKGLKILRHFHKEFVKKGSLQENLYAQQSGISGDFKFYDYGLGGELLVDGQQLTGVLMQFRDRIPPYFLTKPQLELREMASWISKGRRESNDIPAVEGSTLLESMTRMETIYDSVERIRELSRGLRS